MTTRTFLIALAVYCLVLYTVLFSISPLLGWCWLTLDLAHAAYRLTRRPARRQRCLPAPR